MTSSQKIPGDADVPTFDLEVRLSWDEEARVWWAESDQLPGLVSEAPTVEAAIERVKEVIPDLLQAMSTTSAARFRPGAVTFQATRVEAAF